MTKTSSLMEKCRGSRVAKLDFPVMILACLGIRSGVIVSKFQSYEVLPHLVGIGID